jgi:hypothetical protein
LPVTFDVLSGPATVIGDQLNLTGTGTVVVRASQAGSVQFVPASVERSIAAVDAPSLQIERQGSEVRISWASWANDYSLESVAQLEPGASWQPVTTPPVTQGNNLVVVVPAGASPQYFRLRGP